LSIAVITCSVKRDVRFFSTNTSKALLLLEERNDPQLPVRTSLEKDDDIAKNLSRFLLTFGSGTAYTPEYKRYPLRGDIQDIITNSIERFFQCVVSDENGSEHQALFCITKKLKGGTEWTLTLVVAVHISGSIDVSP